MIFVTSPLEISIPVVHDHFLAVQFSNYRSISIQTLTDLIFLLKLFFCFGAKTVFFKRL
jgi:hypothetical protein